MSWGYKITFLYLGFAALVATMITLAMRERVDLVTEDYYEQELHYQDRIDAIANTNALKGELTWQVTGELLILHFPEEMKDRSVTGSIFFFRPSDARLDQTVEIPETLSGTDSLPLAGLRRGMYRMQITWKVGITEYYNEGVIQLQ